MSTPEQMEVFRQYLIKLIETRINLVNQYLEDCLDRGDEIGESFQRGRLGELKNVLHTLKGS